MPSRVEGGMFNVGEMERVGIVPPQTLLQERRDTLIQVQILRHCWRLPPSLRPALGAVDNTPGLHGLRPRSTRSLWPPFPPRPCTLAGSTRPPPKPAYLSAQ